MQLAIDTGIPVAVWAAEPDEVIATVIDIYQQRAAAAERG